MYKKKIFTFFESEKEQPAYINLCIKTWLKNIPDDYEVIILNNKNLTDYITQDFLLPVALSKRACSSPHFFDFIAAVVLYCNGGIFLDSDTIMTDKYIPPDILLSHSNIVLYGNTKTDICPGFIMACKNSPVLEELIRRLRFLLYLPELKKMKRYSVLNNVLKDFSPKGITVLDCEETGYWMEKTMYGVFDSYLYQKYYFSNICSIEDFIKNTKGLTALHNSFTPQKYKIMDEKKFLNQNILLSKIFKVLL